MSDVGDPKPPSLFVAMPCYGGIEPAFVESLLKLEQHLARLGVVHEFRFLPGESLITRARNRMVHEFLEKSMHSHLLFLDCDLSFTANTVVRLLTSGHEVVAAPYAKKASGAGLVGNPEYRNVREVDGKQVGDVAAQHDGFARARDVGTGCLLIARTAFLRMIAAMRPDGLPAMCPYTDDMGTQQKVYPFFDCGPEDSRDPEARYLSEDYFFCRLWQVVGRGEVWVDVNARIRHVGKFAYEAPTFAEQWRGA